MRWDKDWSVYLLHTYVIRTTFISKYVDKSERNIIIWQKAFDCKWHQQIGNQLEKLKQFFMWKYLEYHMNISDANAAHHATYALGGTFGHEHVG